LKRGPREQEDVRIRRQGQGGERSPVSLHLREAVDSERIREEPSGAEEAEQAERRDVTRDHERQRGGCGPDPSRREVGSCDEPGERDADGDRRRDDAHCQDDGVPDEPPGRGLAEYVERSAAARDPDDQIREREEEQRDDDARRHDERERGACPRSPSHDR